MAELVAHVAALTRRGPGRSHNEDRVAAGGSVCPSELEAPWCATFPLSAPLLACIADGLGGHAGGEEASRLVTTHLAERQLELISSELLAAAIGDAHARVRSHAAANPPLSGMASTVAGVLVAQDGVHAFNVGDSRVYAQFGAHVRQLSLDDRAPAPEAQGMLLQSVGGGEEPPVVHVSTLPSGPVRLLLVTDGVTDVLDEDSIESCLAAERDDARAIVDLLSRADARGRRDDASLVLVRVEETPHAAGTVRDVPAGTVRDVPAGTVLDTAGDGSPGFARPAEGPRGGTAAEPPAGFDAATRSDAVWLPSELAARFNVVRRMSTRGHEADLFVVRAREGGEIKAVKLYRYGVDLDRDALELVRRADAAHVVLVEQYGRAEGHWYEVQEYVEAGSLTDLLGQEGPALPADLVERVVAELAGALAHLHGLGMWHRDIKPDNILVRSRDPLDLVLTDFGLAVIAHGSFASASRTPMYAAPEALWNRAGPFRDYWSLGITVLQALTGRTPFDGLNEWTINRMLAEFEPIDLSGLPDDRWRLLCAGLLTWDPDHRWGAGEVAAWLAGQSPAVHSAAPRRDGALRPYPMPDGECSTPEELAASLARNWNEGVKRMRRGHLINWLKNNDADQNLINRAQDAELVPDDDAALCQFIQALAPANPPVYRGYVLTAEGLLGVVDRALDGDEQLLAVVEALHGSALLRRHADLGGAQWYGHVDDAWRTADESLADLLRGVPVPVPHDALVRARCELLSMAVDRAREDGVLQRALKVWTPAALRQGWYASLGDPYHAEPAALLGLALLGEDAAIRSTVEETATDGGDEESGPDTSSPDYQEAGASDGSAAVTVSSALLAGILGLLLGPRLLELSDGLTMSVPAVLIAAAAATSLVWTAMHLLPLRHPPRGLPRWWRSVWIAARVGGAATLVAFATAVLREISLNPAWAADASLVGERAAAVAASSAAPLVAGAALLLPVRRISAGYLWLFLAAGLWAGLSGARPPSMPLLSWFPPVTWEAFAVLTGTSTNLIGTSGGAALLALVLSRRTTRRLRVLHASAEAPA